MALMLVVLLLGAGTAWAQSTVYVDTGGNDAFDGSSPVFTGGVTGPKATIGAALAVAQNGSTISIEAGTYSESVNVTKSNLSFVGRADGAATLINITGGLTVNTAGSSTTSIAASGNGVFQFGGNVALLDGALAVNGVRLPSGVTITRTDGSASGSFVFGTNTNVVYNGSSNITTGAEMPSDINGGSVTVALTGGTTASPRTLTHGSLTVGAGGTVSVAANNRLIGPVTVDGAGASLTGPGAIGDLTVAASPASATATVSGVGNVTSSGALNFLNDVATGVITVTAGTTTFAAKATAGDVTVQAGTLAFNGAGTTVGNATVVGGTLDFNANALASSVNISNTGTLDINGVKLAVTGDFVRNTTGAGTFASTGTLEVRGTGTSTFAPGPNFTLGGFFVKPTGAGATKTVNLSQNVNVTRADSAFFVATGATVNLADQTINVTGGGTSNVNGPLTATANGGVVFTNGGTLTGTGDYSNIAVVSSADVTVVGDVVFTGTLSLTTNGLAVGAGADLSPKGSSAQVLVNLAGANTDISGSFNADNVEYNLTYVGNLAGGTKAVGTEFETDDIRNLLVQADNGVITGNVPAGTISGTFTIENGDLSSTAAPAIETITLNLDVAGATGVINVAGAVSIDQNAVVTIAGGDVFELRAAANTVGGTLVGAGAIRLANGVAITGNGSAGYASMLGNVTTVNNATASIATIKMISGAVVTTTGATLSVGLVADNGAAENAAGNIAGPVTLDGAAFNLTTSVEVVGGNVMVNKGSVNMGANNLVLSGANAMFTAANDASVSVTATSGVLFFDNTGQQIDANGKAVPNVTINNDVALLSAAEVSTAFVQGAVDAEFTGAFDVTMRGTASIAGDTVYSGSEDLIANGLTVTLRGNADLSNLEMDGNLTLTSTGTGSPFDLTVMGDFEQDAGVLDLTSTDLMLTGAGLAYNFDGGSVAASTGFIEFMGGAAQTYDLAAALTIPNLSVNNATGVSAAGTRRTLTVGNTLALKNGLFDFNAVGTSSSPNGLAVASMGTIIRWAGSIPAAPSFPADNSLTVIYGDQDGVTNEFANTTSFELPATLRNLAITDGTTTLVPNVGVTAARVVTVTNELRITATFDATTGAAATDNRVVLQDNATYVLGFDALVVNGTGLEVVLPNTYNLTYDRYRVEQTGDEFGASNVNILTVNQAEANTADMLTLNGVNRTVGELRVTAGMFDLNGKMFSSNGNVSLAGANSLVNNAAATRLVFTGGNDAMFTLPGGAEYDFPANIDLEIAKADTQDVVKVMGASIDMNQNQQYLRLTRGVLSVGMPMNPATAYIKLWHQNNQAQNAGTPDNGQGFITTGTQFPASMIAGNVRKDISSQGVNSNPGRVVFPTGDSLGNYSPFVLDFESNAQAAAQVFGVREVRVAYVPRSPGGRNGLPLPDAITPGANINDYPNFYWLVSAEPTLGQQTIFDLEARADGYKLATNEQIQDLRLIRRQSGNEQTNPYTLVSTSGSYDNFLLQRASGEEEPVVVARNAQALLGPQATIFTYGVRGTTPPPPSNVASIQIAHFAPTAPGVVDVYVDSVLVANDLSYGMATNFRQVMNITGTKTVSVAIAPGTSTGVGQAVATFSRQITQNMSYTVVAVDGATAGSVDVVAFASDATADEAGRVTLQALHASPDAGNVDLMLEVAGFSNRVPFATNLAYKAVAGPATVDAGKYDVEVMSGANKVYSATFDLAGNAGQQITLVAGGLLNANATQQTRRFQLFAILPNGTVVTGVVTTEAEAPVALPTVFALKGSYPNPFNVATQIALDLPQAAEVAVEVYDLTGRRVMHLTGLSFAAGTQRIAVDGASLTSGVYLYRVTATMGADTEVASGSMTLTK